jgi:hypothetical protein
MINETGNWTERRETEKRPLRHRARLPPGAIVGNNVGSGSTPAATRQTTCWKCWWRTQSKSNLSPLPDFPANREINREFRRTRLLSAILKADRRANSEPCSEIPYSTEQGIFAKEQGICTRETAKFDAGTCRAISERDFPTAARH